MLSLPRFALLFFWVFLGLLLSSCGGSAGSSETESPPTNPNPDAGLLGVDSNSNGIRDDVDQLIAQEFSATPEIKKAAEQKARALQSFMLATTAEGARTEGEKVSKASACVRERLPGAENQEMRLSISREIEGLTVNNAERLERYVQANLLAGGAYFPEPVAPICD